MQPYDYEKISVDTKQVQKFQIEEVVENGSQVEAGEMLLRLDDSEVKQKIEDTKLDLESAKNNLLVAREEKKKKVLEARMEIQDARFQLEMAKKNLEKFTSMEDEKSREEKEMAVKQAKVKVEETKSELKAAKQMQKKGLISEAKLDRTRVSLENAQFELKKAKMQEQIYKKYTAPIKKTELKNKVQRRQKQLASRKSFLEAIKSQKESDVKEAQAKLENVREKLKQLKADLEKLTLKAPTSGIVNYGSPGGGGGYGDDDVELEVGNTVKRGRSLMYIPDLDNMYVHMPVDEGDISKLLKSEDTSNASSEEKGNASSIDLSEIDRQTFMTVFRKAGREKMAEIMKKMNLQGMKEVDSLSQAIQQLSDEKKQMLREFLAKYLDTRSKRFRRLDAQITSESFPNAKLTGTLDYVAGAASQESWWSDVKKFDTKIKLNEHYDWFRPGMNVKVELTVERTDPIRTVPMNAIFSGEGQLFCFRKTGSNSFEKVFVRTGRSDGEHIEIRTGALESGDRVTLARPDEAQVTQSIPLPDEGSTTKNGDNETEASESEPS